MTCNNELVDQPIISTAGPAEKEGDSEDSDSEDEDETPQPPNDQPAHEEDIKVAPDQEATYVRFT